MDSIQRTQDGQLEAAIRRTSKELFGSSDRLRVAAAIAARGDDLVYASELARELNLPDPVVRRELRKFAAGGILLEHDRISGNQPAYFERRPSVYWDLTAAMLREVRGG